MQKIKKKIIKKKKDKIPEAPKELIYLMKTPIIDIISIELYEPITGDQSILIKVKENISFVPYYFTNASVRDLIKILKKLVPVKQTDQNNIFLFNSPLNPVISFAQQFQFSNKTVQSFIKNILDFFSILKTFFIIFLEFFWIEN